MSPGNKAAAPAGIEHITLYVAIEISRKSWVIGLKSPAGERIGVYTLAAADVGSLQELIEQQQAGAERALGLKPRILCCHEAGYEGFWPARWLEWAMDVETIVLDPASLLVNRKAKQRKTDRIDARKMVRALLAHDRGDAAVLSRVRIPSVEAEDRKRLQRERLRLVKMRTSLTNTIKGLLMLHGVFGLEPRGKSFEAKFAEVTTAYGEPFPPRARQEILRLFELLSHVERQIAQVEAEHDAVVRQGEALVAAVAGGDAGPGKQDGRSVVSAPVGDAGAQAASRIAMLTRMKGIGVNDATLLTNEIFYRGFRNRRELASWVGIVPTPWSSGDKQRDQGDRPRRTGLDPGPSHSDGVALAALSARQSAEQMVRGTHRRRPWTDAQGDDRGPRPQAADRLMAVCRDRSRADGRQGRLISGPYCSSPAGRGRAGPGGEWPMRSRAEIRRETEGPRLRNAVPAAYRRYLRRTPSGTDGRVGPAFEIDAGKLADEAQFDGISVLRTNTDLPASQAVLRYRDLLRVEEFL